MKNARLLVAVITNILDEAIIMAIIIVGLPRLGVNLPLWATILVGSLFLVYAVGFYIRKQDYKKETNTRIYRHGRSRRPRCQPLES